MSPSSPTAAYSRYRNEVDKSGVPKLGYLCFYSVADAVRIPHAEFVERLDEMGLKRYAPPAPKDGDVFRKSCTNGARKKVPVAGTSEFDNYLVREAGDDAGHHWRQVVVERVDAEDHRLGYTVLATLHFSPQNPDEIEVTWEVNDPSDEATEVVDWIRWDYEQGRGYMNSYVMRMFIQKAVTRSRAVSLKPSGGLYFILDAQMTDIDKIRAICDEFVADLDPTDLMIHTIPLPDDKEQRLMLMRAYESETKELLAQKMAEVDSMLTNGVQPRRLKTLMSEIEALKARTQDYRDLLGDKLTTVNLFEESLNNRLDDLAALTI